MNAYSLYHAQAVYEGQRREERQAVRDRQKNREKRVVNLTRSAYTGQQRYGTILWSGDIEASWETLRKQVAAGLHFSASGLPFWTVDIGAFFVKRGNMWFWKGEYDQCAEDPGYRELFVRWYQWGCFLPVFRGHGTLEYDNYCVELCFDFLPHGVVVAHDVHPVVLVYVFGGTGSGVL